MDRRVMTERILWILLMMLGIIHNALGILRYIKPSMEDKFKKLLDPVIFTKALFDFNPFDYQKEFFEAAVKHRRIALVWGRQSGKTTAVALYAIFFAFTHAGTAISQTKVIIVSRGLRQSIIMFRTIKNFLHSSQVLKKSIIYESRTEIIFSNHSTIICQPTGYDGSTIRGHHADLLIIDEAAFVKESIIAEVCLPMLATTEKQRGTGFLILLSTPFGRDHIFYRAFMNPEFWTKKIPTKLCPLVTEKFLAEQKRLIGTFAFEQEYEAEFKDDRNSWYKQDLLRQIQEDYSFTDDPVRPGYLPEELLITHRVHTGKEYPHQIGLDLAKYEDYTVLYVWRTEKWKTETGEGEKQRLVFKKVWPREIDLPEEQRASYKLFDQVIEFLKHVNESFNVSAGCIDATASPAFVEQVQKFMPQVKGITFTDKSKQDMQVYAHMRMEQRKVVIASWDTSLVGQLNEQQYELSGEKILFSHPKDRNDDEHWACVLGIYSTKVEGPIREGGVFVGPKK